VKILIWKDMEIKTIGIDIGHNCPPDIGARGIKREDELVQRVGELAIAALREQGIKVIECNPNRAASVKASLASRCDIANKNNVNLFCSLHFNAFNRMASGTEVFAISPVGRNIAKCVLDSIVNLGFSNRGVKDGSHLYVIRNTQMPAILVEFAFCDSQKDMDIYNPEKMAFAFVTGLMNGIKARNTNNFMPTRFDTSFPILRVNHGYGELVERLQAYFSLPIDGVFDSELEAAIKKKQDFLGVPVDGCVDECFWNTLFDELN
jgi:N-acetylmuramoyl-L-alanine amidase